MPMPEHDDIGPPPEHMHEPARRSLEELINTSMPLVRWLAWQRYHAENWRRIGADVEDMAQEILLRAVKQFRHFDPTRCAFSTWLGILANHVACDCRCKVGGQDRDYAIEDFDRVADSKATDPAAGVALVKVLVPVCERTAGAVPMAWVKDARSGGRVQVPTADVINWNERLFVLGDSFDESSEGDGLHRVRFGNDATAWVLAAVRE